MKKTITTKDSIEVRRGKCGYRIQASCASCRHLSREWHDGWTVGTCERHDFPANLDRGICNDFAEV